MISRRIAWIQRLAGSLPHALPWFAWQFFSFCLKSKQAG